MLPLLAAKVSVGCACGLWERNELSPSLAVGREKWCNASDAGITTKKDGESIIWA